MFIFIHVILGSIIGSHLSSAWLIIALGIMSHFILDWIPHRDSDFNKKEFHAGEKFRLSRKGITLAIFDFILMWIFIYLMYQQFEHSSLVMLGILASIAPDIAKIGYTTRLRKRNWYMRYLHFHSKIQRELRLLPGLLIQVIFLIIMLFFL